MSTQTQLSEQRLTHLKQLEAESIHIIREVAAEFERPVMLYSVGKDSAVMLHLTRKAFYPGKPPFPLMHVDTTWKFREMIEFRDKMAEEAGMDCVISTGDKDMAQLVTRRTTLTNTMTGTDLDRSGVEEKFGV